MSPASLTKRLTAEAGISPKSVKEVLAIVRASVPEAWVAGSLHDRAPKAIGWNMCREALLKRLK